MLGGRIAGIGVEHEIELHSVLVANDRDIVGVALAAFGQNGKQAVAVNRRIRFAKRGDRSAFARRCSRGTPALVGWMT